MHSSELPVKVQRCSDEVCERFTAAHTDVQSDGLITPLTLPSQHHVYPSTTNVFWLVFGVYLQGNNKTISAFHFEDGCIPDSTGMSIRCLLLRKNIYKYLTDIF